MLTVSGKTRPDAPAVGPAGARPVPRRFGVFGEVVRALRPHQWVKNLLLLPALVLAHQLGDFEKVQAAFVAVFCFCLCASAGYVVNDLKDREADRQHPTKRLRPFASGALSAGSGAALVVLLVAGGFGVSVLLLPARFTAMLALYVVLTVAYSFWLKRKLLLDVFFLAGLYTLRVLAGGAATQLEVTPWLLAFSIFFFLSLAFAKRYTELARVQGEAGTTVHGRAYHVEDLSILETVGPASGYLAVLVLALYINSNPKAAELYERPFLLWLVCPVLLYWITRIWFFARRRALSEDPVLWALKDRVSLTAVGLTALLLVLASVRIPGLPGRPDKADGPPARLQ